MLPQSSLFDVPSQPFAHALVHTDGACRQNPGPGGWGAIIESSGETQELFGGELQTTNNRMELVGAIKALEALRQPTAVTLVTDSQYVINGATVWLSGWKRKKWVNAMGEPVKNIDLWQRINDLAYGAGHRVEWKWVKGHSGNPGNERADALANMGVDQALRGG